MQIIINNPYRTIGLLADCSEREIQKQKGLIKRFIDVGKEISFETDIKLPTSCNRDSESILIAFAKLEQIKSRVTNGLFWFVNASNLDEPAIDYLKEGNREKAIEIWHKLIPASIESEVTARNCSAFHNLSTLKISLAFSSENIDFENFKEGILLKSKLLNSDFVDNVITRISDETFHPNKEEINKLFAEELLINISPFLDKSDGVSSNDFIEIINQSSEFLKAYILKRFIDKPIHNIETLVEESENMRKEKKEDAYELGKKLFEKTKSNLQLLNEILGRTSIQYTILADKIAEELLRCSTDYFNFYKDSNADPGVKSLELSKLGDRIACGSKIKEKLKDDIKFIEEWIIDKPTREKFKIINADYNIITETLKFYDTEIESISNAKSLINRCQKSLQNIKKMLGYSDEIYLNLSSRVGSNAQNMIISEVNNSMDARNNYVDYRNFLNGGIGTNLSFDSQGRPTFKTPPPSAPEYTLQQLHAVMRNALDAVTLIGTLDMNASFRERYNDNKNTLQNLCNKMGISSSNYSSTPKTPNSNSSQTVKSEIPSWVYWVGGFIIFAILSKACNR